MPIDDLPERIKKHITDEIGKSRTLGVGHFGITELLSCPRKTYYKRVLGEVGITVQQAWWLYRGNLLDGEWTPLFPRNQVRVTHRVRGYPILISGRFDFQDDDGAIADLKTTADLYYIERDGPKDEHRKQVMFYCFCEAKDMARLYYVSFKDALKYDFKFEQGEMDELIADLEDRAIRIWRCVMPGNEESGNPPDRENGYNKKYWECQYCSYKEICYKEPKEK